MEPAKEEQDPISEARRLMDRATKALRALRKKLEEEDDPWERELGGGPPPWAPAGEEPPPKRER